MASRVPDAFGGLSSTSLVGLRPPLAGIVLAESVLFLHARNGELLAYALALHLATVVFCVLAPLAGGEATGAYFAVSLPSLFRLIDLGVPTVFDAPVDQLWLVYLPLGFAAVSIARLDSATDVVVDLQRGLLFAPAAVIVGALLGVIEHAILDPGAIAPPTASGTVAVATVMLLLVGPIEELVFRGLVQGTLVDRYGARAGLVLGAVVFAAMHAQYGSVPEIGFTFLVGLLFGWTYQVTRSLAIVAVVHGVANVVLFGIL